MKEFIPPSSLSPRVQILEDEIKASSAVKRLVLEEFPAVVPPGREIATKHFFIKQAISPEVDVSIQMPEYFFKVWLKLNKVVGAMESIKRRSGNQVVTVKDLVDYYKENKTGEEDFKLEDDESLESRIEWALGMITPEVLLQHQKNLYERHRAWYNKSIPNFVIDKLFMLGETSLTEAQRQAGMKPEKRGYVIKPRIEVEERLDFVDMLSEARTSNGDHDDIKSAAKGLARECKMCFTADQIITLRKEIKDLATITRNVMTDEHLLVDLTGLHSANIIFTPDGHIRMVDTDRVYAAQLADGRPDWGVRTRNYELEALDRLVEFLE